MKTKSNNKRNQQSDKKPNPLTKIIIEKKDANSKNSSINLEKKLREIPKKK